jgi:hypothetical protein
MGQPTPFQISPHIVAKVKWKRGLSCSLLGLLTWFASTKAWTGALENACLFPNFQGITKSINQ